MMNSQYSERKATNKCFFKSPKKEKSYPDDRQFHSSKEKKIRILNQVRINKTDIYVIMHLCTTAIAEGIDFNVFNQLLHIALRTETKDNHK